jgi:hypothetical protein
LPENAVRLPVGAIALAKVAFDLEIELLRKIAGQIDARPAQSKRSFIAL